MNQRKKKHVYFTTLVCGVHNNTYHFFLKHKPESHVIVMCLGPRMAVRKLSSQKGRVGVEWSNPANDKHWTRFDVCDPTKPYSASSLIRLCFWCSVQTALKAPALTHSDANQISFYVCQTEENRRSFWPCHPFNALPVHTVQDRPSNNNTIIPLHHHHHRRQSPRHQKKAQPKKGADSLDKFNFVPVIFDISRYLVVIFSKFWLWDGQTPRTPHN